MVQLLQDLRLLVAYPMLTVAGMIWMAGFWIRWRHTHCAGDHWAMLAGLGMFVMGVSGVAALWIAGLTGFTSVTSTLFTVGLAMMALLGLVGAWRIFLGAWRLAGRDEQQ